MSSLELLPPAFLGLTFDRAKVTFTSEQLQAVVSHAIRQSSETSSFRLMLPETLVRIQKDIEELELLKEIIVLEYELLVQRQREILKLLAIRVDDSLRESDSSLIALKDVCASLENSAKWWHDIDKQLAQLAWLCQNHFSSALAVALGKLHNSFLRQSAEMQALRKVVRDPHQ
jgi:hypothetical protein